MLYIGCSSFNCCLNELNLLLLFREKLCWFISFSISITYFLSNVYSYLFSFISELFIFSYVFTSVVWFLLFKIFVEFWLLFKESWSLFFLFWFVIYSPRYPGYWLFEFYCIVLKVSWCAPGLRSLIYIYPVNFLRSNDSSSWIFFSFYVFYLLIFWTSI